MRAGNNDVAAAATLQHCRIRHDAHVLEHLKQGGRLRAGTGQCRPVAAVQDVQAAGCERLGDGAGELDGGERLGGGVTGEHVTNQHVAGSRGKRGGDGPRLAHANLHARRLGDVEPGAHILGELGIQLNDRVAAGRVQVSEIARHGARAAAQVGDAQLRGVQMLLHVRGDDRRDPAHVLKIQLAGFAHDYVGGLHAVDEQQPAVGVVAVGDELRLTRGDGVHACRRALHGGALGIVDAVLLLLLRLLGFLRCPALFRHTL